MQKSSTEGRSGEKIPVRVKNLIFYLNIVISVWKASFIAGACIALKDAIRAEPEITPEKCSFLDRFATV